jgi:hypothetical protein
MDAKRGAFALALLTSVALGVVGLPPTPVSGGSFVAAGAGGAAGRIQSVALSPTWEESIIIQGELID